MLVYVDNGIGGALLLNGQLFSGEVGFAGEIGLFSSTFHGKDGLLDDFTGKKFIFDAFSGTIKEGTNNIGELTAIKIAIENFNNKTFQLIISDSIYGIKSYREYIHVWKNNGYKTYSKKEIKNKDLIIETYEELKEVQKNKIVLLKWTKGHDQNSFNEKCDELAKKELGI